MLTSAHRRLGILGNAEGARCARDGRGVLGIPSPAPLARIAPIALALLSAVAFPIPASGDPHCSAESRAYAESLGGYYDPEEAYAFGALIQRRVARRDLAGLFALVRGELRHGPRKRAIERRAFDEVFSGSWRRAVLAEEPPCDPVGYRGFMIANGYIWFDTSANSADGWRIITINGANRLEREGPLLDPAWRVEGKILTPKCFVKIWMSSDNFELYEERYGIADTADFRRNTGRYFGREIDSLDPIEASWGEGTVPLAVSVDACAAAESSAGDADSLTVRPSGVSRRRCDGDRYCAESRYRLLAAIAEDDCRKLAPSLPGQCESAYLVQIGDYSGGSMGWDFSYNVYGLFRLGSGRKVVVPLVNFALKNDAENFIEDLAGAP